MIHNVIGLFSKPIPDRLRGCLRSQLNISKVIASIDDEQTERSIFCDIIFDYQCFAYRAASEINSHLQMIDSMHKWQTSSLGFRILWETSFTLNLVQADLEGIRHIIIIIIIIIIINNNNNNNNNKNNNNNNTNC